MKAKEVFWFVASAFLIGMLAGALAKHGAIQGIQW